MIAIEKLTKIYTLPNKEKVIALNEVSLRFADKGMVFIVGKSGCGKSTLLNVLGGLDKFDEGEMSFKGKSFKDFTNGDYENYRNHNVGFVFQESNLLEGFSVGENLSLALELQGKAADKAQIDEILKSVGLDGIANRKVTELSGGQKQRVAVARALIKNSDIILADEPTGNLDSGSAKELFDILKEISKDKLVIVVSHDTESANTYGDRIVEMSDGKVIGDDNAPEAVATANAEEKRVKKGRMKFPKMLRISARNLKTRVVRLVVMIVLFSVSLGLFGTGLCAYSLDLVKISQKVFTDIESGSLSLSWTGAGAYTSVRERNRFFTQEEIAETEQMLGYKTLPLYYPTDGRLVYTLNQSVDSSDVSYTVLYGTTGSYSGFVCLDGVDLSEYGLEILAGRLPADRYEVAIPYYAFLLYQKYGVAGDGEFDYDTPEKILGKSVNYFNEERTIVGVIDTGLNLEKYEALKTPLEQSSLSQREYIQLRQSFLNEMSNGLHKAIYINSELLNPTWTLYNSTFNFYSYEVSGRVYIDENVDGIRYINRRTKLLAGEIAISRREILEEIYINHGLLSPLEFQLSWQNGDFDEMDVDALLKKLSSEYFVVTRTMRDVSTGRDAEPKTFRVVGIMPNENEVCISADDFSNYYIHADECIISLVVGCAKNPERYADLAEIAGETALAYGNEEMEKIERLNVSSAMRYNIEWVGYQIPGYIAAGLLGSVLFCVFSALLILNFFATTIKDKHKEIGILIALGTGNKTIFAIYFMEALIVTLISVLLGTVCCVVLNSVVETILFVPFRVLRISAFSFFMTLILALFVAFVGSAAPIFAISRRKPAEVIRK